jgi:tripartite ATP-independent transporter DctP family solute receptor
MTFSRRGAIVGLAAAGATIAAPSLLRARTFIGRVYHPQPEDSHLDVYLKKIWNAVRVETGAQLTITVHARNNNVEVGEPQLIKDLQAGALEFFVLNGNILSQVHPAADLQGLPFAFSTSDQICKLTDGAYGAYLRRELEPLGVQLIPLGLMENGFKHITSRDRQIRSPDDLVAFRMRVPGGKLFVELWNALGAESKIVNFNKMYDALKAGEVDGQENPLVIAEENKLYDVCRYVTMTGHQWAGFNMLANRDYWKRFPEDLKDAVIRNVRKYVPMQREFVRQVNASMESKLKERGMVFVPPDVSSFRKKLADVGFYKTWKEFIGQTAWSLMEETTGKVG